MLRDIGAWFTGAVVCPFVDFFTRYGTKLGFLILAFAASYRLTDFTMGVMANPFYIDVGYTLKEIAAVAKGFGLFASIVGVLIGGVVVARLGTVRSLVLGSLLVITSNLMFMTLAWTPDPSLTWLALVVSADNLAMGVAGTALIAYLSSLTSPAYTATQYALFSSAYALPGKLLMGGSGFVVDQAGYPWFFIYTSLLGLPALVLLWLVVRQSRSRARRAATGVIGRSTAPRPSPAPRLRAALVAVFRCQWLQCAADAPQRPRRGPKLIAYVTGWSPPVSIDTGRITHVNFAFARIDGQGRVVLPDDASATRLAGIVALKRSAPALRVLISVGGWGAEGFSDAALTEESRARFADSAVALMRAQAADGIDLDWEYPGQSTAGIRARAGGQAELHAPARGAARTARCPLAR